MKINATIKKELAQSLCELSDQLANDNIKKETAIAVYGLLFLAREDMDIQDQEILDYCTEVNEEVPGDNVAPWSYYTARDITEILGSGSTREAEYWTDSEADAIAAFLNGRDFLRRKNSIMGKYIKKNITLIQKNGKHCLYNNQMKLSEWKMTHGVRTMNAFQAKRFVKWIKSK